MALLSLLTGDLDAAKLLQEILAGQPISRILTEDFARLTLGGSEWVKLTSDYAFKPFGNSGGGVVIGWLGGSVVLFPVVGTGALATVNYLGLPKFNFTGFPNLDNIGNIIPSISVGAFTTPIPGVTIPEWSTSDLVGSAPAAAKLRVADVADRSSGHSDQQALSVDAEKPALEEAAGDEDQNETQEAGGNESLTGSFGAGSGSATGGSVGGSGTPASQSNETENVEQPASATPAEGLDVS